MKRFNRKQFVEALGHDPWDTAFVFEEVDDTLRGGCINLNSNTPIAMKLYHKIICYKIQKYSRIYK